MRQNSKIYTVLAWLLLIQSAFVQSQTDRPLLLAHFMPWHQTPEFSGYWGWHWTMSNHFNPENMENGRREIASHYYPLTGPYDSEDPDILEYQTLLMKLSGIDGVLVDWYGMEDFWDYGVLNRATGALFQACEKAGLSFAICYEDQTIGHMIDNNHIAAENAIAHGQHVMQYLETTWFNSPTYQKMNEEPLLLVFGPQYFKTTSNWNELFSVLSTPPLFFTEDNRIRPAVGAYPWPPMWKSNADGILTLELLNEYLTSFYSKAKSWNYLVAGVFPQFHDIYKEAGVNNGYGRLEAHDGATFQLTLDQALAQQPDAIQLITWNDYGEGTMIEPTWEFGYRWLEMVLQARLSVDSNFYGNSDLLPVPFQMFGLRKEHPGDTGINQKLTKIFGHLISGEITEATVLLADLGIHVSVDHDKTKLPAGFLLKQNYPNPFNPSTNIAYTLPGFADVTLNIYNSHARLVRSLKMGRQSAGDHAAAFDAAGLPSGIYFYGLNIDGVNADHRKMLLIR